MSGTFGAVHLGRRAGLRAVWSAGLSAAVAGCLGGCDRRGQPAQWATKLPSDLSGGWVADVTEWGHRLRDGRWPEPALGDAPRQVHTLVLGGGVAGLTAAHTLVQAGLEEVVVLDLATQPGGNARGHTLGGRACPLGAHYLPVPGEGSRRLAAWLEAEGLIHRHNGRWAGDERHRVHAPQERLFLPATDQGGGAAPSGHWPGQWLEGLWPVLPDDSAARDALQAAGQRLHRAVAQTLAALPPGAFAQPTASAPDHPGLKALDAQPWSAWLDSQGVHHPGLRWWLDYSCRDDYGVGLERVSAWAGLHYLLGRHGLAGLHLPGVHGGATDDPGVLTWPEGNANLVARLAAPLGARWRGGQVAVRLQAGRHEVRAHTVDARSGRPQAWVARQAIVALPLMVLARLLDAPWPALSALLPAVDSPGHLFYAPWLVSNLWLDGPLPDRTGAPLAWDNVFFGDSGVAGVPMPSLGYVNSGHQAWKPAVDGLLLTHYWALGGRNALQASTMRQALARDGWRTWADRVAADLARVHPELPARVRHMDLARHGHGMVVPVPGLRSHPALAALQRPQGPGGRCHLAHSDLSAHSVFEEAHAQGDRAAQAVLAAAGMARRMA